MDDSNIKCLERKVANPCILVIFGITGDLAKRLLYPAICNLGSSGLLPDNFSIVGVSGTPYSTDTFREVFAKNIHEFVTDSDAQKFGLDFINRVSYLGGDFNDLQIFENLRDTLGKLETESSKNYIFYLAVPPQFFSTISFGLSKAGLLDEDNGFRRLVIEKPFGNDAASARELDQQLLGVAKEKQIFRIDHFLAKETVQNIFTFRFSNDIFEPIWNRQYIDHVQITVAETIGVESRGRYYDETGALRDMIPNHLFQVLSFIAMEPPLSFTTHHIQEEKTKVIQSIQILTPEQVLEQTARGQYGPGEINGVQVPGYRTEKYITSDSATETYAAMKLYLNNWRWLHVPFYLRTGKRMKEHTSQINIQFRSDASRLFRGNQKTLPNLLRIFIQPDEGISLRFNAKVPCQSLEIGQVNMSFKYSDYFGAKSQTGYESILYECLTGQHMLFSRAKMTEACWDVVQPILDVWSAIKPRDFPNYAAGSWGPKEGEMLLRRDGRHWYP
jgi:glucose-6-phosphate 1-dehydrogenase